MLGLELQNPIFEVYRIFSSLSPEKDSLGPGLDALELEMAQVVIGSPIQELETPHFLINRM